ncbi:MAG TPA: N-acetyl-D-Glu racemase DgcA [Stellaceae bacterium]|jgi:L-alanine-DL-glutamate epimerase-like enolase superfamily enzyme
MAPRLIARSETWPLATTFRFSLGRRSAAEVVVAEIIDGELRGRGEGVPYPYYGETAESVLAAIRAVAAAVASGFDRRELQLAMKPGAARNALDCAFWDLEAKRAGTRVAALAGLDPPRPLTTAYSLGLDTVERMAEAAAAHRDRPLLKLRLTGTDDLKRICAVHEAAPGARLIGDANERWTLRDYARNSPEFTKLGVALIEQPLSAIVDAAIGSIPHPVKVCADEACCTRVDLDRLVGKYDAVNIKLDKTGGLTEALALADAAVARGLAVVVGGPTGTSLGAAPATLVGQKAQFVDLSGPTLLAKDREPGLRYDGGMVEPPSLELWG